MNKRQLVNAVAARMDIPRTQVSQFLETLVEVLSEERTAGEHCAIMEFDSFRSIEQADRIEKSDTSKGLRAKTESRIQGASSGSISSAANERTVTPAATPFRSAGQASSGKSMVTPRAEVAVAAAATGKREGLAAGLRDVVDGLRASARQERPRAKRGN